MTPKHRANSNQKRFSAEPRQPLRPAAAQSVDQGLFFVFHGSGKPPRQQPRPGEFGEWLGTCVAEISTRVRGLISYFEHCLWRDVAVLPLVFVWCQDKFWNIDRRYFSTEITICYIVSENKTKSSHLFVLRTVLDSRSEKNHERANVPTFVAEIISGDHFRIFFRACFRFGD